MTSEHMDEESFARCTGCGGPTRQRVVRVERPVSEGGYFIIPVYHSECVPKARQSGSHWLQKGNK